MVGHPMSHDSGRAPLSLHLEILRNARTLIWHSAMTAAQQVVLNACVDQLFHKLCQQRMRRSVKRRLPTQLL